jgi:ribosomal protein L30/L7E
MEEVYLQELMHLVVIVKLGAALLQMLNLVKTYVLNL